MREIKTVSSAILVHPEHGPLRARRVLDCVFALLPDGRILHRHVDDLVLGASPGPDTGGISGGAPDAAPHPVHYVLGDLPPSPTHGRCRVIPPRVPEF